jgi:ABC-type antimicrobial peptide transport system permease subunit
MTPPSSGSVSVTDFDVDGIEGDFLTQVKLTDSEYFKVFELDMLAGKPYQPSDTANGFVVNESLLKSIGLQNPEDIIGRNLKVWGKTYPVTGVVKDFHTLSLDEEVGPTILFSQIKNYYELANKINSNDPLAIIKEVEKSWNAQYDYFLFHYQFLDEQIAEFYEGEKKMTSLLSIFSGLAIFIGCIGLYGLVSFMASEREKEIGVRKVLGASTSQILVLFSREFVLLIFIAFVFAAPVSGYAMGKWLEKFEYHIELSSFMFVIAIGATLFIALATVSYQAIRASLTNPVDVLKDE